MLHCFSEYFPRGYTHVAGPWDNIMKRLVNANPQAFVKWLVATAIFLRVLDGELKSQHTFADALLEILIDGISGLLHLEFQTEHDEEMEVRLLEYNVLASRQYEHRPVFSFVIYLRKTGKIAKSPFIRRFADREVHRFHFQVIKLWEVPAEQLLQMGWQGLLPLVTLAKGGKKPEVVKTMIDRLVAAHDFDLLAIAQMVGGLAFKPGSEQEWFRKRFSMYQDVLRESWVYQEIGQEFFEKGQEEERQRRLQGQREILMSFVQAHFPEITALAQQQADSITDPEILQNIVIKLLATQRLDQAKQMLLDIDKSATKH